MVEPVCVFLEWKIPRNVSMNSIKSALSPAILLTLPITRATWMHASQEKVRGHKRKIDTLTLSKNNCLSCRHNGISVTHGWLCSQCLMVFLPSIQNSPTFSYKNTTANIAPEHHCPKSPEKQNPGLCFGSISLQLQS